MKQQIYLAVMCLLLAGFMPASAKPTELSIQIQTGQVRETPSFLGKIVTTVQYGDRVELVVKQGVWSQIKTADGKVGWMHESALTRDKIVLKAGAADVSRTASGEELALAGKGFNSQVEADFKEKNQNIDFTWIDRMEGFTVKENDMVKFLKEGGLQQ